MVSPPRTLSRKKKEQDGGTTNLERTGIGMNMGIGDGKPAPVLKVDLKKKGQEGVATNPERTDIGMGMCKGGW